MGTACGWRRCAGYLEGALAGGLSVPADGGGSRTGLQLCLAVAVFHSALVLKLTLARVLRASWFIANEIGVSSIPVSEVSHHYAVNDSQLIFPLQFYCAEHTAYGERFARFSFCKDVDTLKQAVERLQGLKKFLR